EAVTLSGRTMQQTLPLAIARVQEMIRVTELPPPAPPAPGPDRQRRQREFRQEMADRCGQAPASACLEAPIKLKDVRPVFPPSLAGSRADQTVTMHGVIGVDGFIHDLEVTADAIPGDVASAAMAAVSQWQFEPTRLDGQPVETGIDITVRFAPAR
ncbi:MAG: energy transducer TonB, partial [Betaproteobacteria bacterium]